MAETLVKLVPATVTGPRTACTVRVFRGSGGGGVDRVGGAAGGGVQASCWVLRKQALLVLRVRPGLVIKLLAVVVGVWWRGGRRVLVVV
jgi:hypothetical protein